MKRYFIIPTLLLTLCLPGLVFAETAPAANPSQAQGMQGQAQRGSAIINLNTANVSELETLPGIGPKLAQSIITYRETKGQFKSVEDLRQVPGFAGKRYTKLEGQISV